MSRFVSDRGVLVTMAALVALSAGNLSSASYASDWGDILKPLVKDVIIPGAKIGVKKWNEKKAKDKAEEQAVEGADVQEVTLPDTSAQDVTTPTPDGPEEIGTAAVVEIGPDGQVVVPPPPEPTP